MAEHLILIRHSSHLRKISEDEVKAAMDDQTKMFDRSFVEVDTTRFWESIEQEDWDGQDTYLRTRAAEIARLSAQYDQPSIHYYGLAEIPHMIALGAFIGAERNIQLHHLNHSSGAWEWTSDRPTIQLSTEGLPSITAPVKARGGAVIRVSISAAIADADVHGIVGDELLADITVGLGQGDLAKVGNVASLADVRAIRLAFRDALAALRQSRPNVETIHLFVAAGASVCFAVGQELRLRNSPPVQTYRYRKLEGKCSYQRAILLRNELHLPEVLLTEQQVRIAAQATP